MVRLDSRFADVAPLGAAPPRATVTGTGTTTTTKAKKTAG